MVKNLVKHGNSVALILDKPILDLINIDPEAPLEISTDDGKRLILSPVRDPARLKKIRESLVRINQKHGKALKKLAE